MKTELLTYIFQKMPTQQKTIMESFAKRPEMESELTAFLARYDVFMQRQGITYSDLAQAYLNMLAMMLQARMDFTRTGKYPVSSQQQAIEEVYNNRRVMTEYMLGLALSQFLWRHHYDMFAFYRQQLDKLPQQQCVLEVGSGHGLHTLAMLERAQAATALDIVDISEAALEITKTILTCLQPDRLHNISLIHADIMQFASEKKYDFITMGEVLEHVPDPLMILKALKNHMHATSRLFVTTCANSPAIDHIYHFHNIAEIRQMLVDAGYIILDELIAPSVDRELSWLEKRKLDISYAAILEVK